MIETPRVSVIIPYYNHGQFLQSAVQSALMAAGEVSTEILIVNDGSREPGASTFLKNATALPGDIRVIAKSNGGLSSARNAGLDHARGKYIQFLDSDDELYPEKFSFQIRHLESRPDLVGSISQYTLGDHWMVNLNSEYDSIGRFPLTPASFLFLWERGFSVPIHCALLRRDAIGEQRFDTSVEGKEDWIFWSDLLRRCPQGLGYLPILGAAYRMHGSGMTRSHERMGASFLTASAIIEDAWRDDFPGFKAASLAWYRQYYAPRIETEQMVARATDSASPVSLDETAVVGGSDPKSITPVPTAGPPIGDDEALIDIVIPVYNHYAHLSECVTSALAQSGVGRIVIVDDASPDGRVEPLLCRFAEENPRVLYLRNSANLGVSASQNVGVDACQATFVGFLDCDDALEPTAGERMVRQIERVEADYYFTDRTDIDEAGRDLRVARYGGYSWLKPSGNIPRDLLLGMVASHWKVIRRTTYLEAGGSSDAFSGIQDWVLALAVANEARFSYLPEPLYRHRIHRQAVTSTHATSQMWKSNVIRHRHLAGSRVKRSQAKIVTQLASHKQLGGLIARAARLGAPLIFEDQGQPMSIEQIDLLREFNGIFDEIRVGENAAVALAGYLWDHHALKIVTGELNAP